MSRAPNRLQADSFDVVLADAYPLRMTIAWDRKGIPTEIVLKPTGTAGKSGGSLDLMYFDLGVMLSRLIQRRDPKTGAPLE
jgi:hypothetical protein